MGPADETKCRRGSAFGILLSYVFSFFESSGCLYAPCATDVFWCFCWLRFCFCSFRPCRHVECIASAPPGSACRRAARLISISLCGSRLGHVLRQMAALENR